MADKKDPVLVCDPASLSRAVQGLWKNYHQLQKKIEKLENEKLPELHDELSITFTTINQLNATLEEAGYARVSEFSEEDE